MKEHYVSYECAQALKRLGFDKKVSAVWHFDGEEWNLIPDYGATFQHPKDIPHWNTSRMWGEHIYSAPRLDQAAAWIRDCKGIDIEVTTVLRNPTKKTKSYMSNISYFSKDIDGNDCGNYVRAGIDIHSYENALSIGINKALELLGKEVKE